MFHVLNAVAVTFVAGFLAVGAVLTARLGLARYWASEIREAWLGEEE